MKEEYDFSGGEPGKFYRADADLDIPIYPQFHMLLNLCKKWLRKKGVDVETIRQRLDQEGYGLPGNSRAVAACSPVTSSQNQAEP